MPKMLLPGICLGSLILVLAGCAEPPQLMEEGEKSVTNFTLRPQQSYILSYSEEEFTFSPRISKGKLGKVTDDYNAGPLLAGYEKTMNTEKWDSTGEFFFDKSYLEGTYAGNFYIPENDGMPVEGETQKSKSSIDNEIVRITSEKTGIRRHRRNGSSDFIETPQIILSVIQEELQKFNSISDTSGIDTSTGFYGKKLDILNQMARESGMRLQVGNGVLSLESKVDENGGFLYTLVDMKTENILQEAFYENGDLSLLTRYNYVRRGNRFFQSTIHTRLFKYENGKPEVISETLNLRKNIRVTPL